MGRRKHPGPPPPPAAACLPLAGLDPGPELAAELAGVTAGVGGLADLSDAELIEVIQAQERLGGWVAAAQIDQLMEFARRRPVDGGVLASPNAVVVPDEFAFAELACALTLTSMTATRRLMLAVEVSQRIPRAVDALRRGLIDLGKLRVLHEETADLPDTVAAMLVDEALQEAASRTTGEIRYQLRRRARSFLLAEGALTEEEAEAKAREEARAAQNVWLRERADGNGDLGAVMPAGDAATAWAIIDNHAKAAKTPGDKRSIGQRRAAALIDLLNKALEPTTPTGGGASGGGGTGGAGVRTVVNVLIPLTEFLKTTTATTTATTTNPPPTTTGDSNPPGADEADTGRPGPGEPADAETRPHETDARETDPNETGPSRRGTGDPENGAGKRVQEGAGSPERADSSEPCCPEPGSSAPAAQPSSGQLTTRHPAPDDPPQDGPPQDGPPQDGPPLGEPPPDESTWDEPAWDEPASDEARWDQASSGEAAASDGDESEPDQGTAPHPPPGEPPPDEPDWDEPRWDKPTWDEPTWDDPAEDATIWDQPPADETRWDETTPDDTAGNDRDEPDPARPATPQPASTRTPSPRPPTGSPSTESPSPRSACGPSSRSAPPRLGCFHASSGEIDGLGPLAAWAIRDLITDTAGRPGTSFRAAIYDPDTGQLLALGTPKYRPPGALAEHIRLRDRTCRFPGCRRAARRCDVDHTKPWAPNGKGGTTEECNLRCLCRFHHRLKQSPRWNAHNTGPTTQWTTPTGHTHTTTPHDWRDP